MHLHAIKGEIKKLNYAVREAENVPLALAAGCVVNGKTSCMPKSFSRGSDADRHSRSDCSPLSLRKNGAKLTRLDSTCSNNDDHQPNNCRNFSMAALALNKHGCLTCGAITAGHRIRFVAVTCFDNFPHFIVVLSAKRISPFRSFRRRRRTAFAFIHEFTTLDNLLFVTNTTLFELAKMFALSFSCYNISRCRCPSRLRSPSLFSSRPSFAVSQHSEFSRKHFNGT